MFADALGTLFVVLALGAWLVGTGALALFVFRMFYEWWRHT